MEFNMATVSMKKLIFLKVPQLQHRRKAPWSNFNFYLLFFVCSLSAPLTLNPTLSY